MKNIDKKQIIHLALDQLKNNLKVLQNAAQQSYETSIDEENIPEHKYDTLALEASYLAEGQAQRIKSIEEQIKYLMKLSQENLLQHTFIAEGSLVHLVKENGTSLWIFICKNLGGINITYQGLNITIVSIESPLAKTLMGKEPGDEVEIQNRQKQDYEIISIY